MKNLKTGLLMAMFSMAATMPAYAGFGTCQIIKSLPGAKLPMTQTIHFGAEESTKTWHDQAVSEEFREPLAPGRHLYVLRGAAYGPLQVTLAILDHEDLNWASTLAQSRMVVSSYDHGTFVPGSVLQVKVLGNPEISCEYFPYGRRQ